MNKDKRQEEITLDQSQYMEVGKPLFRKANKVVKDLVNYTTNKRGINRFDSSCSGALMSVWCGS